VWARRLKETFAILTVGDGIIELIFPTEHSLLWEFGPARVRRVARSFAENPNLGCASSAHPRLLSASGWRSASTKGYSYLLQTSRGSRAAIE
jgi:hypothetical protein